MEQPSSLQVNCGFTSGELHLLMQGTEKMISECHSHTTTLSNIPNGSMDDNTINILEYYSRRMKAIRDMQTRLQKLKEELTRKQNLSAHNL